MKAAYRQFLLRQLVKRGLVRPDQIAALSPAAGESLYGRLVDEQVVTPEQAHEVYQALSEQIRQWNRGTARRTDAVLLEMARKRGFAPATATRTNLRAGTASNELGSRLVASRIITSDQLDQLRGQLLDTHRLCEICGDLARRGGERACGQCGWPDLDARPAAPADDDRDNIIGRTLGSCRLLAPIGAGGMGAVYRAHHEALRIDVAVKLLPRELAVDETFRERFFREARLTARLDHPGILRVMDVGVDAGLHYIVMELVDGQSLDGMLDAGPLAPTCAVEILREACEAVIHAHERGLIHRDLKPANLLLTRAGRVKVADFGLVRELSGSTLSLTGAVMGSPGYLSPEQAMGERADRRSDIYALGVTFYALLTGASPFVRKSLLESLSATASDPVPPLPEALTVFDPLVQRMCAVDPAERYPDLRPALDELGRAMACFCHAEPR